MKTKQKPEAEHVPSLLKWYMTNGTDLYRVIAHTKYNITLENCYTNLHTVYDYDQFVGMRLRKVVRRGEEVA